MTKDKTILIVDDDESIAKIIKLILKKHGFRRISIVNSGNQALAFLKIPTSKYNDDKKNDLPASIDLVILDVFLPDLSGFEVCDQIKKNYGPTLPVIIITGFDIPEYVARGVEVGGR